jgi:hypothetical protein
MWTAEGGSIFGIVRKIIIFVQMHHTITVDLHPTNRQRHDATAKIFLIVHSSTHLVHGTTVKLDMRRSITASSEQPMLLEVRGGNQHIVSKVGGKK